MANKKYVAVISPPANLLPKLAKALVGEILPVVPAHWRLVDASNRSEAAVLVPFNLAMCLLAMRTGDADGLLAWRVNTSGGFALPIPETCCETIDCSLEELRKNLKRTATVVEA